jgi:arylsulfatase A-like enzyme
MSDDMGAYDFSCYKGTNPTHTPNIDKLAETGIQFRTAYATSLCTPSRAMIMTGKYATRTGIYCNWSMYNVRQAEFYKHTRFQQIMKESGYATALAGKWNGYVEFGEYWGKWDQCNPEYFDESLIWPRTTSFVPDSMVYEGETVQYTDHFDASRYWQPLLLKNGTYLPTSPDDYAPDMFCDFLIDFMKRHSEGEQPFFIYYPMCLPHGEPGRKNPQPPTPGGEKNMREYVDVVVGRLVRAVDELDLRDNTIIIFTSDNGSGSPPRGKNTSCEPAFWVPFIVNCPGKVPASGLIDEMVSLADVFPTFVELAGASYEEEIDGISFLPVLEGKPGKREYLYSYIAGEQIVRDRRWLLEQVHESREGTFWDCGDITAGSSRDNPVDFYKNVSDSDDPEVLAARERFNEILLKYKPPAGIPFSWEARRDSTLAEWARVHGEIPVTFEKSKFTK